MQLPLKMMGMRYFPRVLFALLLFMLPSSRIWAQLLTCQPCAHGFGRVAVGSSKTYLYTLVNTGTKALKISGKSEQGPSFSFGSFTLPLTLAPGASAQLPVNFTPTSAGWRGAVITLVSNAIDKQLTMNAGGTGALAVDGQLSITPLSLNFGSVTVGSSASLQATLSASNGPVTITGDQLSSSEFSLQGPAFPLTLAAGQSVQATLQFTPNASGAASGKIKFLSSAANSPLIEPMSGTGVAPTSHSATLTWDPSTSSVVGYNVYRGNQHTGPYSQINTALQSTTNYTDSTVAGGATYYYVARAVDAQGMVSQESNETSVTIPNN